MEVLISPHVTLQNKDLLVLTATDGKSEEWNPWRRGSFLLLTLLYGLDGVKIKNKKNQSLSHGYEVYHPFEVSIPFSRTFDRAKEKKEKE